MKRITSLFLVFVLSLLSLSVHAQDKTGADYFASKWNVVVKGTPSGDRKMVFILDKTENTINGEVQDTTGKVLSKIVKAEVSANAITVYFFMNDHDVSLELTKKDEDHAFGSAMGMFDAEAERVKATK
jgi:hypothetical protein